MIKQYIYSNNDEPIISIEEQTEIVKWTRNNYKYFSSTGYNRYMQKLDYFDDVPICIWEAKKKIVEKEDLYDYDQEPMFKDSIGYMLNGGQLHIHNDPNPLPNEKGEQLYHTRFNLYVQIPEKGGYPIYNEIHCTLNERTYICCRSNLDKHYCAKVEGEKERIVVSFGFLLPLERIQNIVYNY
jgi:hypothetical protein